MRIIDWTFNQSGVTRAAAIFFLAGAFGFVLFVAIGSALMLPFGATMAQVFAGAIGAALGTGLVNGILSLWWS